jgi:hypothetical protein
MGVQGMFPLTHWHSHALTSIQGVFSTHSKVFTHTHKYSGGVQYWLKGVHVHSQALRVCSILTQRRSCALTAVQVMFSSDTNENFLMVTPWWVAFNSDSMAFMRTHKCSHSLIGSHAHSMGVQGVFNTHSLAVMHIQWVFRSCSHSLIDVMCTHKCSGSVQHMFSLCMYLKAQWICFQICEARKGPINLRSISVECHFFGFAKKEDMMSQIWLVGGLGAREWDWQQKIRK